MGATLTGQIVSETYDSLLKVTDNGVITGTKKRVTDGFGNDTPLLLSSTDVQIDGNLLLSGTTSQYVRGDGAFATFTSGLTSVGLTLGSSGTDASVSGSPLTSNGAITLNLPTASATNRGLLSSTDWSTFNSKQGALTLTTSGSSGASTLVGSTLNIPNYTLSGLGGVPTSRTLTINGTTFDLSANRSWTITDTGLTSVGVSMPSAFSVSGSPLTSNGTITISGAGTTAQYIDGTGALQTFPTLASADRLVTEVYNKSGATLTKGTIVYISGTQGNLPSVSKALATGDSTSAQTFGFVQSDISNMSSGYIVQVGKLSDMNTNGYIDGTQLYLSPTTAGTYTSTKPYAPYHLVYVGIVVRAHPTQGIIEVKIQNGFELDELHDVSAQSPSNNDGIFFNTSTSLWEKKSIATALGFTPVTNARTISTTSPLSGGGDLSSDRTLSISQATTSTNGYLSSTDWNTFNGKESALTFSSPLSRTTNTISIPAATSSVNGYLTSTDWTTFNNKVPASRTLTINGTAYDLSADRTWTIGGTGISTLNTLTATTQTFAVGTSGTDFAISSATSTHTFNLPTASATNRGALSSADWSTFNGKQATITGGATTITSSNLTASRALVSDGSGKVAVATTTSTEIGYVNGVTSAIQTQIDAKADKTTTFNIQTGTSYTLVLTDAGKIIEMQNGGANIVYIPLNSSVAFPIGTEIQVLQFGAGQTTITPVSGVTTKSKSNQVKIGNQYTGVTLVKRGTNDWYIIGNLTA